MRRRNLLLGGAAASVFGLPSLALGECGTGSWGQITCGDIWAGSTPASKLLDIHIMGGMAPWESIYYRPDGGRTRGFDNDVEALLYNSQTDDCVLDVNNPSFNHQELTDALGGLNLSTLDAYGDDAFKIGQDASNKAVHLGPFGLPLRLHRKMWDRTRVIVQAHDLSPHEAAIPFVLAGKRLGRPNFCGLGAPISRAEREATGGGHPLPYSYALKSPFASTFPAFGALGAEGGHGGANKPLVLKPGPDFDVFVNRLLRGNVDPTAMDAANAWYRQQYADWLTHSGQLIRTPAFDDHYAAIEGLMQHQALHGVLNGGPDPEADSNACTSTDANFLEGSGISRTSLNLAAHLLTRTGDQTTRYVGLVDEGLEHTGLMQAYDVHQNNSVQRTSRNFWNLLQSLSAVVNDEGETDPNKIDLDDTMIVITTEFGRTPFRSFGSSPSSSSNGRDHWPQGYAVLMIGGPITQRAVVGSLTDGTGVTGDFAAQGIGDVAYNPTDIRAAALVGLGIYPFEGDAYQVGQITPSLQGTDPLNQHAQTMANLRTTLLGVS